MKTVGDVVDREGGSDEGGSEDCENCETVQCLRGLESEGSGRKRRAHLFVGDGRGNKMGKDSVTEEKEEESGFVLNSPANEGNPSGAESGVIEELKPVLAAESNKRRRPQYLDGAQQEENVGADSVPKMICELEQLLDYVNSKPKLREGSASFIRDYLRTLLVASTNSAAEEIERNKGQVTKGSTLTIQELPNELVEHVFSFLDGPNLANVRLVCRQWNVFAHVESKWKVLCLKEWPALATDPALWRLIDKTIDVNDPYKWEKIFPKVMRRPRWTCRLQKTGRFICNLTAHQVGGSSLGEQGLPYTLVVERRFNTAHLSAFVSSSATYLYFEPETEQDRVGYEQFIDYLAKRTRAGLAIQDDRRFIFVPPCEFSADLEYTGTSLLGIVQTTSPTAST